MVKKSKQNQTTRSDSVSLSPLPFEKAVAGLLAIKPEAIQKPKKKARKTQKT